jgi:hypothetical protein
MRLLNPLVAGREVERAAFARIAFHPNAAAHQTGSEQIANSKPVPP